MFDQSFSFGSASANPSPCTNMDDYSCGPLSPCSSPMASPTRIVDFPRHATFSAADDDDFQLSSLLKDHAIDDDVSSPCSDYSHDSSSLSSSDSNTTIDYQPDEGFFDGPGAQYSDDSSSDFDPTLWDLSQMKATPATSSPRPSLSLEAQAHSSYTQRRRQRQVLVRLQCIAQRAPDLAMLIEERHPSSLPLACEVLFTNKHRKQQQQQQQQRQCRSKGSDPFCGSTSSSLSRVEKPGCSSCVRKPVKMRKRATR